MNIGFLIYGSLDTLSGGYLYDRKLVDYLRAQGDTVEIISLPWRNYAAHLTDNLRFRLPSGLDLVIEDELNHPSLIGANRAKHPYPVISLVHHLRCSEPRPQWQNDFYRVVEKRYLNSVDGFIFNSETTKSVVNGLMVNGLMVNGLMVNGLMVDGKPSVVAYPPTDRFGVRVTEEDIAARAKRDEFHILFLGNVIERKGLHTLLDAVALAAQQDRSTRYHLDVVGSLDTDPRHGQRMKRRAEINEIAALVEFHGSLNNEPLAEKLRQAHVLVVPSSYEGFGIVYLEGMGFGLPAIGTTAGAAGEIIEDGKTGYLVAPEEPGPLALCLLHLASDRDLLTRMSVHALERYRVQPKWDETAGKIREFLQNQIHGTRTSAEERGKHRKFSPRSSA
jgi:glycosyltransferase involved in cell wall biosynthesis